MISVPPLDASRMRCIRNHALDWLIPRFAVQRVTRRAFNLMRALVVLVAGFLLVSVAASAATDASIRMLAGTTASSVRIGAPFDCESNPFCALGLKRFYGVDVASNLVPLTPGAETFEALEAGRIDIAVAFSTDPELRDRNVVVLEDDRDMIGADNIIPASTGRIANAYGKALEDRLNAISAKLSTEDLVDLNGRAADGAGPAAVARAWLRSEKLAGKARRRPGPTIVIGAQDFRENRILAQVYAKGLKAAGFKARVHRIKGFRQEAIDAAVNGDVNMLIEYAASFLEFLNGFRGFSSENVAITVDLV